MNKNLAVFSLELKSLFGINRFLHIKDPKQKKKYRGAAVAWVALVLVGFFTVGLITWGLWYLGLVMVVPAYLVLLASLLILIFGIFGAGNRIFGERGYDILASLPVKSETIVMARIFGLYVGDLILALVIMAPGIVMYGILAQPPVWFYVVSLVGTLFVPIIPLMVSMLFGGLVMGLSSRMKNKNIMQTVLSLVITLALVGLSTLIQTAVRTLDEEKLFQFAEMIGNAIRQFYPPAMWLSRAMVELSVLDFLLFAGVSLAGMGLATFVVAKNFQAIVRRLSNFTAKHDYEIKAMRGRSLGRALYVKEWRRYLASSVYFVNTIMGPIVATAMIVIFGVTGTELVQLLLSLGVDVAGILPLAFTAIFTMMTMASVSISMEGRQIWIVKSLPIPTRKWLLSKVLLNLSLMVPFYVIGVVAMTIILKPDVWQFLWIVLMPAVMAGFVVVFGIFVNLKSHSFEWEREELVVKQSLPAMVGGFVGPLLSILLGVALVFVPNDFRILMKVLMILGLVLVTIWLWRVSNKKKMVEL